MRARSRNISPANRAEANAIENHQTRRTMETNRIFSAEQIVVHPDLPIILKDYSKALIRANPKNIDAFSAEYFRQKAGIEGDPVPGSAEKNEEA